VQIPMVRFFSALDTLLFRPVSPFYREIVPSLADNRLFRLHGAWGRLLFQEALCLQRLRPLSFVMNLRAGPFVHISSFSC